MSRKDGFNAKQQFEKIYEDNQWGKGSGEGSLPENTKEYREFLEGFLKDRNIKSVVDLGCGDWQIGSLIGWKGIDYTGIDVVDSLIDDNATKYGSKNIRFLQGDISTCSLPPADLIIIKDVIQHWPTKTILEFLPKLKQFKYSLVINDNYPDATLNKEPDASYGHFRPVALLEEPFKLKRASKIYSFRTDPKMPKGFNNKEVLLVENNQAIVYFARTLQRVKESIEGK